MPIKDPEIRRESRRRYYEANREKFRERQNRYNEAHREERRAAAKRRYREKREELLEQSRRWREANPEKVRENMRRWRANGGTPHRRRIEATDRLWHAQNGCCYLCDQPIPREDAVLEHDHRCCARLRFCDFCIRGVACQPCNHVIGSAKDDPARLELIAQNLRTKLAEIDERLAAKLAQFTLEGAN